MGLLRLARMEILVVCRPGESGGAKIMAPPAHSQFLRARLPWANFGWRGVKWQASGASPKIAAPPHSSHQPAHHTSWYVAIPHRFLEPFEANMADRLMADL